MTLKHVALKFYVVFDYASVFTFHFHQFMCTCTISFADEARVFAFKIQLWTTAVIVD